MELIQYIRLFRKWLWLILIAAFVAGGISFIVRSSQPSIYQASTTIAIGSFIQSPNPDSSEIRTGVELAQTYAELATTYSVLQGTVNALDITLSPDDLRDMIDVRILTGTSLLVLRVSYTDPVLAADIANEVARQLVLNSPTNLTAEQQKQIALANDQIARLDQQLTQTEAQLQQTEARLADATDQAEIDRLTAQRNALITQSNQAAATIAEFTNTVVSLQQRTNSIDVVESARVPTQASGGGVVTSTLLGAIVGAALAVGVVLLIEYLDDTMRSTEDVAQTLGLPVLGAIIRLGKSKGNYRERLITNLDLMISPLSEGYRAVRTNLMFGSSGERNKVYLVTSPGPQEGKSLTSSNLAISLALSGMRVLLIDCDLRRPRLHEIFGLNNQVGLTRMLYVSQKGPIDGAADEYLSYCVKNTFVENLRIITSGYIPQNPTELLGSGMMQLWMDALKSANDVDVIILDTPPCLMLSDSSVLAASTQADVILVVEAGRTRRGAALRAKEQFQQVGREIKGVILNGVSQRDENYYGYGYGYGYGYYEDSGKPGQHTEHSSNGKTPQVPQPGHK